MISSPSEKGQPVEVRFFHESMNMGILLAFAPFIVFAVVDQLIGSTEGLLAGAVVSAALLARDWLSPDRKPKILEIGTTVLFCGLAVHAFIVHPDWTIIGVRLRVDAGLLIIVLITMAVGRPFTLQYAREQVAPELWTSPEFVRTNYVITAVWALAFTVLVLAELTLLYLPDVPPRVGILATIAALVGAVKFTSWYPARRKAAAGR
jgi:hypothetical protein